MKLYKGYTPQKGETQRDSIVAVISTNDLKGDYKRLKDAGVPFLGEPQFIEDWEMSCVYFRDPEGNLFELNEAAGV